MKRFLKRMLLTLGALAGLLLLFHLVENWRGARALARWQAASLAAGEPRNLEQLAPPRIPDGENFAKHPSIADDITGRPHPAGPVLPTALADSALYRTWEGGKAIDVEQLKANLKVADLEPLLEPFADQLRGLEEASLRPHSRIMEVYDDNIPTLLNMRQRARILSLRAVLALRAGRSEAGLADVLTILRMAGHLQREPHLITQLLRIAQVRLVMQPIWEGLRDHRWNDAQLVRLQEALGAIDLLDSWRRSWLAEQTYAREHLLKLASAPLWPRPQIFGGDSGKGRAADYLSLVFLPKGWVLQNMIRVQRLYRAQYVDIMDPARHRLDARASDLAATTWARTPRSPYTLLAKLYTPDASIQNTRLAQAQSSLDQAIVACGLERYRLAHRDYPERFEDLGPTFSARLPRDLFDGQPLRYRKRGKDAYLLYSIGWNGTDEGGQRGPKGPDAFPATTGDWVWMDGTAH